MSDNNDFTNQNPNTFTPSPGQAPFRGPEDAAAGNPYRQGGAYSGQGYRASSGMRPQPSRGGAVALIIFGTVATLVLAPLALAGTLAFALLRDFDASTLHTVENSSSVEVGTSGIVSVVYAENFIDTDGYRVEFGTKIGETTPQCSIVGDDVSFDMIAGSNSAGATATNVPEGTYTLQCSNADGQQILLFTGEEMAVIANHVLSIIGSALVPAFIIISVIAVVGILALIVGIARLVRVNRARSTIEAAYYRR